ncbi:MAG: helix-turn-helix transcriptional regulator [Nitrospina sp.]|nr:helix-turn-helix transcriptional regulator [Nitrospina sp.]
MNNHNTTDLSEKDYLSILETIQHFQKCRTRKDLRDAFESHLLSLFEGQAGVLGWMDSDLSKAQIIDAIGFSEEELRIFPEWIPYEPLCKNIVTSSRPVWANDVDVTREEEEAEVQRFFIDHPNYARTDYPFFDRTKTAILSMNHPELSIGLSVHRQIPHDKPFTLREIRIMELLMPHIQQIIKSIALSIELSQFKSLATEALNNVPIPMAMVRSDARILYRNQAFDDLLHLQTGQVLPVEMCTLMEKEIAQYSKPLDLDIPKIEISFFTLPGGDYSLSFTRLPDDLEFPSWLLRLKPINGPYSKINLLMQQAGLTPREMEVCILVKDGIADQEISSRLFISPHTVKNHAKSIHKKLEVNTRPQLVALLNQEPSE